MVFTVQECKCLASGQGTEDGNQTAATWPWFALIDEGLGQSAGVSPPRLIASIHEEKTEPSTAQASGEGRNDEEEGRESDRERGLRTRQREGRKRERGYPSLTLLRKEIKYQREADERREAEAREQDSTTCISECTVYCRFRRLQIKIINPDVLS